MKILSAKNPRYTANGNIDLLVNFEGVGEIPFSASPNDTEEHGRELFANASAGDYGTVAPYVVDLVLLKSAKKIQIETERDEECCADVNVLGYSWQADQKSRELLTGAILLAQAGGPLPAKWMSADNYQMQITNVSQLIEIAGSISAQTEAAYEKSWQRKDELNNAETQSEIEAV